ncbi:MAG TPA: phosphoribosylformylglycinamidine cyclo-ligase [Acholeplasmataceae bacterium]|jgi:phosphoribosylformylglycinamidine cyclo-ligase|nr:phosphoribosylformylglycinamidine cyclo-ligase [Acholeplasmataceae bacterium]
MSKAYKKAGVDLEAGYQSVALIKKEVEKTRRPGVLGGIGSFGGLFSLAAYKDYREPVLVSGTDGVGTKLKLAFLFDKHDTVGEDLVAMSVNDVLAQGAEPLFFLDYIATGKIKPEKVATIVSGVASGCVKAGVALLGGETAEMPDMYGADEYDLAGFAVGIVEREKIIDGRSIATGDLIIGLPSSGLHSNGFSLVRKLLFKDNAVDPQTVIAGKTLMEHLLTPTKIYVKEVLPVIKKFSVRGIVHITGGGFDENIPRVLNPGQGVEIYREALPEAPIFAFLQEVGKLDWREMYNVFNMGIGMILIVGPSEAEAIVRFINDREEAGARIIGRVTAEPGVVIR